MKPWYACNMGCFSHMLVQDFENRIISQCITCSWYAKNAPCPDHSSKYSTSLWCLHLECCLLETLCGGRTRQGPAISGEARPHRESAFAVRKRSDAKDRKHSEVSAWLTRVFELRISFSNFCPDISGEQLLYHGFLCKSSCFWLPWNPFPPMSYHHLSV